MPELSHLEPRPNIVKVLLDAIAERHLNHCKLVCLDLFVHRQARQHDQKSKHAKDVEYKMSIVVLSN